MCLMEGVKTVNKPFCCDCCVLVCLMPGVKTVDKPFCCDCCVLRVSTLELSPW